ncbi:NAD(P)H dehydrogenase (Quinone) [Pelagerythrobacter marensis]|uniref:NAD(P)H dehydrogenase (Quinone) n=2 Tax=Pelagerythrobacter marensis TaxID=543877 RepID=A0A0G3XBD0_9SPHN|nr:NAD(P)H dehydrogenase (Quinone) [Pelagerythrobacter marensis]
MYRKSLIMHALIVVSHPDPQSLTSSVARTLADSIERSGHSAEIADLAAEEFDPRFGKADLTAHLRQSPPPADVLAEHRRLERADALVLVYPVYWWSMPGLMKGWIDRVFSNGWAYEEGDESRLIKKLGHLPVHLIALPGASERTYLRRGYRDAMTTQIDHGIFDYCGAPVIRHDFLFGIVEDGGPDPLDTVRAIGTGLFDHRAGLAPRLPATNVEVAPTG